MSRSKTPAFSGGGATHKANLYGESRLGVRGGRGTRGGRGGRGGRGYVGGDGRAKAQIAAEEDALHAELGFGTHSGGDDRIGWLINVSSTQVEDKESGKAFAAVNLYFMEQDGSTFKAQVKYKPYFYVATKTGCEHEVEALLRRRYGEQIADVVMEDKEDLDLKNHLSGLKQTYLKVEFLTVQELMDVRREILPIVSKNKKKTSAASAYEALSRQESIDAGNKPRKLQLTDYEEAMVDIREYDVPYHMRYLIDENVRCGMWYNVHVEQGNARVTLQDAKSGNDMLEVKGEPRVCAFDIETTKLPLKFPDAEHDQVFMISYMLDGQGYLITNREIVSEDVEDFEYTPKEEYQGPFIVWNEANEQALLRRWFDHMREAQPSIYVTYNGDYFDFPFIETRAKKNGMDMYREIGFKCEQSGECRSTSALHLDCFCWVKRDSYLPAGSHGLKAVTKAKLKFDPVEVDPEDMLPFAQSRPQHMAQYSVSDAVSTYYLYKKFVHDFIFALSTIIPLSPDEVLRKGSGTLCESLLMVQAYEGEIVCPNKQVGAGEQYYNGHLLNSETYIGGHVECLQAGVYRSDIPCDFNLTPDGYQKLLDTLDDDLKYALEVEGKMKQSDVSNYDEIRAAIVEKLEFLRDNPRIKSKPLIYHLDVAAMYPNIILTNRLQPAAMVTEDVCAACDYNRPGKKCLRELEWVWRGEHFASTSSEYAQIKAQLQVDTFPAADPGGSSRTWYELSYEEQQEQKKNRLKMYTQKVYRKVMEKPVTATKTAGICQRENAFYIDTVRAFRDRRYVYKGKNKEAGKQLEAAKQAGSIADIQQAANNVVLYDSLQLAHKCILNSFYGYVMRKGARWYSMEMAGVVTNTGAKIIQMAKQLVDDIGMPLELDTDGIWCCLPCEFPEDYTFTMKGEGKKPYQISYPCVVLNRMTAVRNTNDQYLTFDEKTGTYKQSSEMSIEFEVDGPYKAMILPASKEEGVLIKKRYAVFDEAGKLVELKGFELKRRGELKLIKVFQSEVFDYFLKGETLDGVYQAVGAIANRWFDMLKTRGAKFDDEELMEYISESSVMSKPAIDYGDRKSTSLTTARRLAQFLGADLVKDKGLVCKYIISKKPLGAPTSQRAIPVSIFNAEVSVARSFLKEWTKDNDLSGEDDEMPDMRDLVDWEYYKTRLAGAIQKIISIPAALQGVENPCPDVKLPDWLNKRIREKNDKFAQQDLKKMFRAQFAAGAPLAKKDLNMLDIEDSFTGTPSRARARSLLTNGDAPRTPEQVVTPNGKAPRTPGSASATEAPDRETDYDGWLKFYKAKWKTLRANIKRLRVEDEKERAAAEREGGVVRRRRRSGAIGLESFVESREETIAHSIMHIIQVEETRTPGVFAVWVYVNGGMQSIKIDIPRRLVIATREADPEGEFGKADKHRIVASLPRGFTSPHLYEVNVPERTLSAGVDISALLADPNVIGVYEKHVDLADRFIYNVGCVMAVKKTEQKRALEISDNTYSMDMFQMKATGEISSYLPKLCHIGFYFAGIAGDKGRGIYVLHNSRDGRGTVIVHQPGGRAVREINPEVWSESLRSALGQEQSAEERTDFTMADAQNWTVLYARNMEQVGKHLNHAMGLYMSTTSGGTILLVQAPANAGVDPSQDASSIRQGLAGRLGALMPASGRLPIVFRPPNLSDCDLNQDAAQGWQLDVAKTATMRITGNSEWLQRYIEVASYAHIPIGNLKSDWWVHTADTFFARSLQDDDQVLWSGPSGEPDLGGGASAVSLSGLDDTYGATRMEVSAPGAYRSVCVELQVHHLAVCAISKSGILNDLEQGALLGFETGTKGTTRVGGHESAGAFKTLRKLVENWLRDATDRHNHYADELLSQLHRWLFSPFSVLRDPALKNLVELCMKKVFTLLLAELRKLQVDVVYADMRRIIIATGKHDLASASSCVEGVTHALRQRELFSWLQLDSVKQWHSLLFRGPFDYAGITAASLPGESQWQDSIAPNDASLDPLAFHNSEGALDMHWNIARFLPESIQDHFHAIVGEFLLLPWKFEQNGGDEPYRGRTPVKFRAMEDSESDDDLNCDLNSASDDELPMAQRHPGTPSIAHNSRDLENLENEKVSWLVRQIDSHFSPKLLRYAQEIQKVLGIPGPRSPAEHQFPTPPGSHLSKEIRGTPALAFVKTVIAVLSLDASVADSVSLLRRNALKMIRVGEFAPEAEFIEPCVSYTLRDVICSACCDCRDLDLCRDPDLAAGHWACSYRDEHGLLCAQPYDRQWVEGALVAEVNDRVRKYQLQDLKCVRDGRVKVGHLGNRCACGGLFTCSAKDGSLGDDLRVFSSIAEAHDFNILRETVSWVRSNAFTCVPTS
ncbi:DNA polymerase epsilon, catalytic subunit A,C-terminal [Ostreococcus tauri]|uniref:DNA polymerase epsilon catalytic subunit n=1 Tax=Ostreococcus tauri TaxID=70448 RepID=Q00YV3_OSTTA|nr:DNA polymerase epsilon, catalytic subunit A,C-terminal [Ostreococcus tauri]CAL55806.1 DNA polymerase epsilon, catalytic subunit A,C-terminal [Ostreococcus tauri]|eukprot:XP_003082003.1 DNA polymerase epsilon, catalytic subunit A,C-terminal [Ostreococcus tauri]